MSTSQHTVPTTTHTYDKTSAHTTTSTYGKTNAHHDHEHTKDEFAGTRGTTSSADNLRNDGLVKTGGYVTGLEASSGVGQPAGHAVPVTTANQSALTGGLGVTNVPTAGPQMQNTVPNAGNRDGLVVNDGLGGARGGAAVLGGQCECTMNGGQCSHGAGNCVCRGCTTKATTVNPGINIGVSTSQYTAPAGTTGIGGGVMEHGTGIAGLVHANNAANYPVDAAHQNCECVKKNGSCLHGPHACTCTHCTSVRSAAAAAAKSHHGKDTHTTHHGSDKGHEHHHPGATTLGAAAVAHPHTHSQSHTSTKNVDGPGISHTTMTSSNMPHGIHANPAASTSVGSTNAYSAADYTQGHPVGGVSSTTSTQASNIAHTRGH